MQKIPRLLDEAEIRVLGALFEKEQTTPELYPLTVNSLLQACNQKTAREPVMNLSEGAVHGALRQLLIEGLVQRTEGARVTRWRHALDQRWELTPARRAVLALLLLRGPQTPGELRHRSERMHAFASGAELEDTLQSLARSPEPLVRERPRAAGQKEARWSHVLNGVDSPPAITEAVRRYASDEGEDVPTRLADLNRRVRELERVVGLLTAARETPPNRASETI